MSTWTDQQLTGVTVTGPFWQATVDILQLERPVTHAALRTLFVHRQPRQREERLFYLPGTLLALCSVETVAIELDRAYRWQRSNGPTDSPLPDVTTRGGLRDALESGRLCLLLLQADPDAWQLPSGPLPPFTCVGGDVDVLAVLRDLDELEALQNAISLSPETDRPLPRRPLLVHASGLSLHGATSVFWWPGSLYGRYRLEKVLPEEAGGPNAHLALEIVRLTPAERLGWQQSWRRLGDLLRQDPAPSWVTLELADPNQVPQLRWLLRIDSGIHSGTVEQTRVEIPPDHLAMMLSDRRLDDPVRPVRTLARLALEQVTVEEGREIHLWGGAQETDAGVARAPVLTYSYERASNQEMYRMDEATFAFDPVETATQVRRAQASATTDGSVLDRQAAPAVLWGAMPLADGWAQLPIPNLTEQIYASADLAQLQTSAQAQKSNVLQGAVVYANQPQEAAARTRQTPPTEEEPPAEHPWRVTLTRLRGFAGVWRFAEALHLDTIDLRLRDPDLVLDGFFWLSTQAPTVADALPDLSNWLGGLDSISLRRVHRGLPLTLPWLAKEYQAKAATDLRDLLAAAQNDEQARTDLLAWLKETGFPLADDAGIQVDLLGTDGAGTAWQMEILSVGEEDRAVYVVSFRDQQPADGQEQQSSPSLWIFHKQGYELERAVAAGPGPLQLTADLLDTFRRHDLLDGAGEFQLRVISPVGSTAADRLSKRQWQIENDTGGERLVVHSQGSEALTVQRIGADPLPAPIQMQFGEFAFSRREPGSLQETDDPDQAQLSRWLFSYAANPNVLARLEKVDSRYTLQAFSDSQIWRRHQTLPFIQALPLTQNLTPPNHPSASRQLFPFVFRADAPRLFLLGSADGAAETTNGAMDWLRAEVTNLAPATLWRKWPDLPAVSLSLPGLVLDPGEDAFTVQYRYDLPYTDELNALAQLPKTDGQDAEDADQIPMLPLTPATYAAHWQRLSTQSSLAALDAVEALANGDPAPTLAAFDATGEFSDERGVQNLIEPLHWPTTFTFDPKVAGEDETKSLGALRFKAGASELGFDNVEDALQGISGQLFLQQPPGTVETAYQITAGSMAPVGDAQGRRDQRGLRRQTTTVAANEKLIATPVSLAGEKASHLQVSALSAETLEVTGESWSFWFRDLPLDAASLVFTRLRSEQAEDVNNPDAGGRLTNYLQGYEWRLGNAAAAAGATSGSEAEPVLPLPFYKLHFYPLVLERLSCAPPDHDSTEPAEEISEVWELTIVGRLQLPLASEPSESREWDHLNNTVRITFGRTTGDGPLKLREVAMADEKEPGDWPLAETDRRGGARLRWRVGMDGERLRLFDLRLQHQIFDVAWDHQLDDRVLDGEPGPILLKSASSGLSGQAEAEMGVAAVQVELALGSMEHRAQFDVDYSLAHTISVEIPPPPEPDFVWYRVQPGDWLRKIAKRFYGDEMKWKRIWQANPEIKNPDLIYVDQMIKIPSLNPRPPQPPIEVQERQTLFKGELSFDLLANDEQTHSPRLLSATAWLFGRLPLHTASLDNDDPANLATSGRSSLRASAGLYAVELSWDGADLAEKQLLPGMPFEPGRAPGFAVLTFTAAKPAEEGVEKLPDLRLQSLSLESLLKCRWGTLDQEGDGHTEAEIFSSSAGALQVAYTAHWSHWSLTEADRSSLSQRVLLNGMAEVTNLISWPLELKLDEADEFRRPLVRAGLGHTRHHLRILLNQYALPLDVMGVAYQGDCLFQVRKRKVWQLLAVVEHRLLDVKPGDDGFPSFTADNERRWTTVQEVRLLRPDHLQQVLEEVETRAIQAVGVTEVVLPLADAGGGYWGGQTRTHLIEALQAHASDPPQRLLVEASAPIWLSTDALRTVAATSLLQYLPNGSQLAQLSSPDDYIEADGWMLLPMPFLGRLQDPAYAGPAAGGDMDPLQVDPIQLLAHQSRPDTPAEQTLSPLALALTGFTAEAESPQPISVLDTLDGWSWSRLDPASVVESWFRLHNLPDEPQPDFFQSVMAAVPNSPARLSRGAALQQLFDPYRAVWPPARTTGGEAGLRTTQWHASGDFVWQPDSLMLLSGAGEAALGWTLTGLLLQELAKLRQATGPGGDNGASGGEGAPAPVRAFVAATALPALLKLDRYLFTVAHSPVETVEDPERLLVEMRDQARQQGLFLSDAAQITVEEDQRAWRITDPESSGPSSKYLVRANGATLEFFSVDVPNSLPVGFAVSPYLALGFESTAKEENAPALRLVSSELLCLDPLSRRLQPTASRIWAVNASTNDATENNGDTTPTLRTHAQVVEVSRSWAREVHRQLSPESPVAILRFREIYGNPEATVGVSSAVRVHYSYWLLPDLELTPKLSRRVFPLRSQVEHLRFREGQFGGQQMPADIHVYEMAPPQVAEVRPFYWLPGAVSGWGLSGLEVMLRYTEAGIGVAGPPANGLPVTLWWQTLHQIVQYRVNKKNGKPAAGLPPLFRTRAIRSLLPVLPQPPLPADPFGQGREAAGANGGDTNPPPWQPILPGALRSLLLGNRPGAMLALRSQILRQTWKGPDGTSQTLVSGSVPVQQRVPRPVPLAANDDPAQPGRALRTWASAFEPQSGALVTAAPADEAYFAPCETIFKITEKIPALLRAQGLEGAAKEIEHADTGLLGKEYLSASALKDDLAEKEHAKAHTSFILKHVDRAYGQGKAHRVRMILSVPEITSAWGGKLQFEVEKEGPIAASNSSWSAALTASLSLPTVVPDGTREADQANESVVFAFRPAESDRQLADLLKTVQHGALLTVRVEVALRRKNEETAEEETVSTQSLSFPLRLRQEDQLRLPLEPTFVHFEDPAYNRRLASATARASRVVEFTEGTGDQQRTIKQTVTLASDRRQYNPDSPLALRYDWDDERREDKTTLKVERLINGTPDNHALNETTLAPGTLHMVPLPGQPQLEPGNQIQITLDGSDPTRRVQLIVDVVAEPVTPVPEAAYALLRWEKMGDQAQVGCVRFAWGPEPARIDLICPEDLRTGIVRRRAVFHWQDTARIGVEPTYAVQKITHGGSTHNSRFLPTFRPAEAEPVE